MHLLLILCALVYTAIAGTSSPGAGSLLGALQEAYYEGELEHAIYYGHLERVRLILADGRVNPAVRGNSAIRTAALFGHAECVKLLLADPRVDPSAGDNDAILKAAENGHAGCVRLLLADPRTDPAAHFCLPLHVAVENGHAECVKLLLADPRVNPGVISPSPTIWAELDNAMRPFTDFFSLKADSSAVWQALCQYEIRRLVEHVRAYKNGDLDAFKQLCVAGLSEDELDIFISRNRSFPQVHKYLLEAQLAYLAIPETVRDDHACKTLVGLARSKGFWRTGQLREIIKTFIRVRSTHPIFRDLAIPLTCYSHDLAP